MKICWSIILTGYYCVDDIDGISGGADADEYIVFPAIAGNLLHKYSPSAGNAALSASLWVSDILRFCIKPFINSFMGNGSLTLFVNTETIGGSSGKLSPTDTTNRAQMAQVLYNLLSK